jgi:hypothetical protein
MKTILIENTASYCESAKKKQRERERERERERGDMIELRTRI